MNSSLQRFLHSQIPLTRGHSALPMWLLQVWVGTFEDTLKVLCSYCDRSYRACSSCRISSEVLKHVVAIAVLSCMRPILGSFIKIRTLSKVIRIYFVGKSIKIPLKWGVNQLSLGLGIRKLRLFKCRKMGPISNTGSVPKAVTWYWHFVCTETFFFFKTAGHFTRKCFYFMIFDCY